MQRRQPISIELGPLLVGQGLIGRAGPLHLPGQFRTIGVITLGVLCRQQLRHSGFRFLRAGQCVDQRRHFLCPDMPGCIIGVTLLVMGMLQ